MSRIRRSVAVLLFMVVGLGGCAHESRTVVDANPARVAETKAALRDLWGGHIFWIRNVVLDNATDNPAARDAAEKQVVANAKQIADTITPFYGEAASGKLFNLLAGHYGAVKEYSEGTIAGSKRQQNAALAHLASNARRDRRLPQRSQSQPSKRHGSSIDRCAWGPSCRANHPVPGKGLRARSRNLASHATTRLRHCRCLDHGVSETVPGQVRLTDADGIAP